MLFCQDLPGQEIRAMGRRGNTFILSDGSGPHLAFADGRQVFLLSRRGSLPKHAHVFFHFTDGGTLVYEDVPSLDHGSPST